MMNNILVTGANGQLGSELQKISTNFPEHRFCFTDIAQLDITNREAVNAFFETNKFQTIINCAAYTAVDKAEDDEPTAMLLNATAVRYLAQACRKTDASLIHISTDYVYSGNAYTPYCEDAPALPASVYGKTKLAGEEAALVAPKSTIIRTSWLYSSFGNNFVKTMLRLGKERDELRIVYDQTGTPTYAADLASVIMKIVNSNAKSGIFNYSNEGVCSWYDFAHEIINQAGMKCVVKPIETKDYPLPAPRPNYSVMNKARIKTQFDLEIPHWKESLKKCLNCL